MNAIIKTFQWSDRPRLSKNSAMVIGLALTLVLMFFKLRPYFSPSPIVKPAAQHEPQASGVVSSLIDHLTLGTPLPVRSASRERPISNRRLPGVLERPLFDGVTVSLKAVLLSAISSFQPDTAVEARVLNLVHEDGTSDLDPGPAEGAKLIGTASVNMPLKRLNFAFSELVTRDGVSYTVTGIAIDPDTKMAGVAAGYSSGLGSRLLSVALDQGITLADQVGTAKVLENTTGGRESQTTQEVQAASMVVSQQTASGISAEATKDLRDTQAELSLPAGTLITVRLRAASGGAHP